MGQLTHSDNEHILKRINALKQEISQLEQKLLNSHEPPQSPAQSNKGLRHPQFNEERFKILLESASVAIIVIDETGQIEIANQLAQDIFAYKQEELLKMSIGDLLPEHLRERHQQHLARFFKNPSPRPMGSGMDLIARRSDGTWFPIEVSLSAIQSEPGTQGVAFIADISERKQAEEEYRQLVAYQQRGEILQKFMVDIAHDLKTPLTIIANQCYFLQRSEDEQIRKRANLMEQNVKRLGQLIDNMLAMSKLDATDSIQVQETNINFLIRENIDARLQDINNKKLKLNYVMDETIGAMRLNANMLSTAFYHVLNNAIIYTAENGAITIVTRNYEQEIMIEIADTGIGIAEDKLNHIFERFYRVDEARQINGSLNGLGLSMVQRIVELHGGKIEVESQPDEGSIFRIFLPKSEVRLVSD